MLDRHLISANFKNGLQNFNASYYDIDAIYAKKYEGLPLSIQNRL